MEKEGEAGRSGNHFRGKKSVLRKYSNAQLNGMCHKYCVYAT